MQTTTRPVEVNQAQVYVANNEILNKVMAAPVVYVRQDPKCSFCPDTHKVYIHTAVIGDGNFEVLKDPIFNVIDEACSCCCTTCSGINFYSPIDNTVQYNIAFPQCCDDCCKGGERTKCCENCCNCVKYGPAIYGSYGSTVDNKFGHYARRYWGCCSCCTTLNAIRFEFFGKMGESRFIVEVDCCDSFRPCMNLYPLHFHILNGEQKIGTITRSPRGCCGTYTYEIEFPAGLTLEDRLLLIGFCCKRAS